MLEAQITAVAQQFAREAIKLENFKAGSRATIELTVKMPSRYGDDNSPKIELSCRFWSGSEFNTVTAGSLGALMDEVHRRCGFTDKQAVVIDRNNAALTALEAPKSMIDTWDEARGSSLWFD